MCIDIRAHNDSTAQINLPLNSPYSIVYIFCLSQISKRALSRGFLPPGATDWARARSKKRQQDQEDASVEGSQAASSSSSPIKANNSSDIKAYGSRPLSEGVGPRRHRKMNQASCNAEAKFKTATATTPSAAASTESTLAAAAASSRSPRRGQHLDHHQEAASSQSTTNAVDPAYGAAVQAWMFGARQGLHPAPAGAPEHRLKIDTNLPLAVANVANVAPEVKTKSNSRSPRSPSPVGPRSPVHSAGVLHAYAGVQPLSGTTTRATLSSSPNRAELATRMPKSPGSNYVLLPRMFITS